MLQFSLKRLMLAVTYVAVAIGAVRFSMESKRPDLTLSLFIAIWATFAYWRKLTQDL